MDLDATFRPVVVVAFFTIIAIALPFRIRSQSTGEKLDRMQEGLVTLISLRLMGLAAWAGVIAFMISPASMAWSSLPLTPRPDGRASASSRSRPILLLWTLRSLGPNLTDTVVTRQAHALVTRGPYQWVRHPFYDCMFLFLISIALMTANWFVMASGVVTFSILAARSRTEEEKLLERFGEPYRAYRASTGRFIPGIGRVA